MFIWYKDKNLSIEFDKMPNLQERYVTPWNDEAAIKDITKKPFITLEKLNVKLDDFKKNKEYSFEIPKHYTFDGASIPRIFWRLIGSKTDNTFLIASLIHDYLCENKEIIEYDKAFSTNVFDALLKTGRTSKIKRFFMKNSVAIFQSTFCKWRNQNEL